MTICASCKEDKGPDRFGREPRNRSGLKSYCKDCNAAKAKQRRRDNPAAYQAALKADRARYAADPGATERMRVKSQRWRAANPDAKRQEVAARRARKKGATLGPVSYKTLRTTFPDCYLCGLMLSGKTNYDHIIPLAKGGAHCTDNLRPTHAACNQRKSDKLLADLDWYSGPTDLGVALV